MSLVRLQAVISIFFLTLRQDGRAWASFISQVHLHPCVGSNTSLTDISTQEDKPLEENNNLQRRSNSVHVRALIIFTAESLKFNTVLVFQFQQMLLLNSYLPMNKWQFVSQCRGWSNRCRQLFESCIYLSRKHRYAIRDTRDSLGGQQLGEGQQLVEGQQPPEEEKSSQDAHGHDESRQMDLLDFFWRVWKVEISLFVGQEKRKFCCIIDQDQFIVGSENNALYI